MAGLKEIKDKITSVASTQKITQAMEMVATSKMRKAQQKMLSSRPYTKTIENIINHIVSTHKHYQHPFLHKNEIKKVAFLVISTDRGLCGGLNNHLFKESLLEIKKFTEQGIAVELLLIGNKAVNFFKGLGFSSTEQLTNLKADLTLLDLISLNNKIEQGIKSGEFDSFVLCFNKFVNTMVQKPVVEQLLPLDIGKEEFTHSATGKEYLYEPEPEVLLDKLLSRYIEARIYQAVLENNASEQASRMVAMRAATDNAKTLINDLQLVYNKVRQSSITNELNEIIAGADAI